MNKLSLWIKSVVLLAFLGGISLILFWQDYLNKPLGLVQEEIIYKVHSGQSFSSLATALDEKKLWRYPRLMTKYVQIFKSDFVLKAGEYQFNSLQTPNDILRILNEGKTKNHRLTFIEGDSLQEILMRLRLSSVVEQTLPQEGAESALKKILKHDLSDSLEGWFFPDTYFFTSGDRDVDILSRAYFKMREVLDEEWAKRDKNLPYKSAFEALIMASLIEKETGVAYERPQIAGVFVRRLELRMRLQTDPTVIYALGEKYRGDLKRSHLKIDSPYNTYRYKGLPPSPIACPGRGAIQAALHPMAGTTLYFVGKGDGTHYFSDTLQEHQQAVRKYQINNRRSDYRSSPAIPSNEAGHKQLESGVGNG